MKRKNWGEKDDDIYRRITYLLSYCGHHWHGRWSSFFCGRHCWGRHCLWPSLYIGSRWQIIDCWCWWWCDTVTEMEIQQGLLSRPDASRHCMCFMRTVTNLEEHVSSRRAQKYLDTVCVNGQMTVRNSDYIAISRGDLACSDYGMVTYVKPWDI